MRTRVRRLAVGLAVAAGALVVSLGVLAAVDEALRRHYAESVGLNRWGYRGPVAAPKQPGERRAVMLGGSTVFGYGVAPGESIPAQLERRLRGDGGAVSVVNLGYVREGAWSFAPTLADYAGLDYDVVVLYEGYNDLRRRGSRAFRRDSPVFRATGYFPFLPLVLSEKAHALRHGADLGERYGREDPVFRPGLADRASAGALRAAADVARSLEHVLGPLTPSAAAAPSAVPAPCAEAFREYCGAVRAGVDAALARGARVLVASQPYIADLHVAQQRQLAAMLAAQYGAEARVRYVDLGRALDLRDPALAFDGMHLTPEGNRRIAEALAPAVAALLRR
ncbi:MAG TPA: GDSL-type esterase/lipase family protein [Terriglobales bacterium]|nr:GDSL-type esterase/lipase family protein [Terriglobales bacterium]